MTQQRYSQQWMIEKLQEMAARLGRSPTSVEATADPDIPSHTTYVKRFGSWTAALRAAGLPVDPRSVGYDRETLLEMLRGLVAELGRTPVCRELPQLGLPCDATFAKHFGSWAAALAEIGLEPKVGNTRYERDELLDVLRDLDRALGHPPSQAELREQEGLPHPSTYKYRFGSWNKALEAAGLTPRRRMGR
jgi:hypothetical protein